MLSVVLSGFDLLFAQTVVDWFIGKSLWREVCTLVPGTDWSIPAWGGCLESMRGFWLKDEKQNHLLESFPKTCALWKKELPLFGMDSVARNLQQE